MAIAHQSARRLRLGDSKSGLVTGQQQALIKRCLRSQRPGKLAEHTPLGHARISRQQTRPQCVASVSIQAPKKLVGANGVATFSSALAPSGQDGIPSVCGNAMRGRPEPLGPTFMKNSNGVNFAILSPGALAMTLCLFTEQDLQNGRITQEIPLDDVKNKTGDVWHIMLPDLNSSLLYGYRATGPHQDRDNEHKGHRFDETKVVVDPYAVGVISRRRYGELAKELEYGTEEVLGYGQTWPQHACVLPGPEEDFDWEGDRPLGLPMQDLVIYEMHVRGFTQDPSSNAHAKGTYTGVMEKIDYLQALGVNAIELLPIQEFNELEYYVPIPGSDPVEYRFNFWGYSTVAFCSPMSRYSFAIQQGLDGRAMAREFKQMVKECHRRGIEVILDVVFNHTAEGNEKGPTLSFRGLDNRTYYMLAPQGEYYNYSGCGNTLNCNQPVVREFVLDCLRYWVREYHVDGFRFDLASILTRAHSSWHPQQPAGTAPLSGGAIVDEKGLMTDGAGTPTGTPLSDPALVAAISEDPVLRDVKLIAEAWDCDGLNQVGAFPHYGGRWAEWNGHFRDTVRQFIKGTDAWAGPFASALCGSPNIYATAQPAETDWWGNNGGRRWRGQRGPHHSINFVTAHDGFTMADLVAYNNKHNEANGEGNKDGEQHNLSWNCGEEGASKTPGVLRLRERQIRNFACALMLAHGVPMLQMGDEYGHTKNGNNNTYCHDSPLNWFQWGQAETDPTGLARFMRLLINFRRSRPELKRTSHVGAADVKWHGELPGQPDWSDASRLVAYTISNGSGGLYVAWNSAHVPKMLTLPKWSGMVWQPVLDTSKVAPFDFLVADEQLSQEDIVSFRAASAMWTADGVFPLLPWSAIVLEAVPESPALPAKIVKAAATGATAAAARPPPMAQAMTFGQAARVPPPPAMQAAGQRPMQQQQGAPRPMAPAGPQMQQRPPPAQQQQAQGPRGPAPGPSGQMQVRAPPMSAQATQPRPAAQSPAAQSPSEGAIAVAKGLLSQMSGNRPALGAPAPAVRPPPAAQQQARAAPRPNPQSPAEPALSAQERAELDKMMRENEALRRRLGLLPRTDVPKPPNA